MVAVLRRCAFPLVLSLVLFPPQLLAQDDRRPGPDTAVEAGVRHAGRPTGAARRVVAAPGRFDEGPSEWTAVAREFRAAPLAASGARLYRVVSWSRPHPVTALVLVRGEVEYFLPQGINPFVTDAGLAADGPAMDELARLVAEALRPDESLEFRTLERTDVRGDDGRRYRARLRATGPAGVQREWEFGYGEGALGGQIRIVRETETRGAVRRVVRTLAPPMLRATAAHSMILAPAQSDTFTMAWYPGEIYLVVRYNGAGTGNRVTFALSSFRNGGTPDSNVYVRVRSTIPAYGPNFLAPQPVAIDTAGNGSYSWSPGTDGMTGLCVAEVGSADPGNPAGTFVARGDVPPIPLTLERVRGIRFPGGTVDSCRVRYCEQFFQNHPLGTAHTETFIGLVINGLNDAWTSQVVNWSLAQGHAGNEPQDADDVQECFVTDHVQDYRGATTGGSAAWATGTVREMWIRNNGFYVDAGGNPFAAPLWTNEDLRTRSAVFHEFFHGVQAGWADGFNPAVINWVLEGQARFLPTVQYEAEEFLENTQHLYPMDANDFMLNRLNSPLSSLSYNGCLYWRFLYDRNQPAGTTAQRAGIVREVLSRMPGQAGQASRVLARVTNAALVAAGGALPDWLASRDSFAVATWRHAWSPDSPSLLYPFVTGAGGGRVSATWSGPSQTFTDSLPSFYTVDYWNFRMDPAANLKRLSLCFNGDPDRDGSHASFHLAVLLYRAGANSARVGVLPRALASWDSTFEVTGVDSVVVAVVRTDSLVTESDYTLTLSPPLAVDAPSWDHIQDVLTALGPRYRHVVINEADMLNANFPWCCYDVIFLNCSPTAWSVAPGVVDSLRAYVARGGYLYVSDWDYEYITNAWPGAIAWGSPLKAGLAQTISAQVTDPGLAAALGSGTASVIYDLSSWVTVAGPGPGTTVHMRGTYLVDPYVADAATAHGGEHAAAHEWDPAAARPGGPATERPGDPAAAYGGGRAVAHEGDHGSAAPTSPQIVGLRTGPLMLSFPHGKGSVVYTTFHNAAQPTAQQQQLLRYMIFRQVAGDLLAGALAAATPGYSIYQQIASAIGPGQTLGFPFPNPATTALEAILNWGGSELRLTARRPDGSVFGSVQGTSPPIKLSIPAADTGSWTFDVEAVDVPDSNYTFALVVAGADPIPGQPLVETIGEAALCAENQALVAIPIRNLAMYADSFAVSLSSDLGWTIAPTDTLLYAWEGMLDSLFVRVSASPGTPLLTLDSLRATATSLTDPANSSSGARGVRKMAGAPVLSAFGGALLVCPGQTFSISAILQASLPCPTDFVVRAYSRAGWSVSPESLAVTVTTPWGAVPGFDVTVPSGAAHGDPDTVRFVATTALAPGLRDSLDQPVAVVYLPPAVGASPPLQALRSTELAVPFTITNNTGCVSAYQVTARDSLGWQVTPDSLVGFLWPGDNLLAFTVRVPLDAPLGATDPIRVVARELAGTLAPDTGATDITVATPGNVLVVDLGGGYAAPWFTAALDAIGRTHTDWFASSAALDDTILGQFSRVVWVGGWTYGLAGQDTTFLGAFLRGGGMLFMSGQDILWDSFYAKPFAAEYLGTSQASEGGGTLEVQGTPGSFLAPIGATSIWGPGGAWNQYSTDELAPTGSGFPVMSYLSGPLDAARTAPPPLHVLWPPPEGTNAAARPGSARRVAPPARALATTGIAGIANTPGTWGSVVLGFGFEAIADSATRTQLMDAVLNFLDTTTPTQLSLASIEADPDHVRLAWYGAEPGGLTATVYRRRGDSDWQPLATVMADGTGWIVFEDRAVQAGTRYGYRLGIRDGQGERFVGEAWVEVPLHYALALEPVRPNPVLGELVVPFSLASGSRAALELFDAGGRRVASRAVGALGAGRHRVSLAERTRLAPGVYVIRLTSENRSFTRRVVVMR
ncbi:MAG: T9SS type A sorting domain-containing protein [Candidatus Eisenbacteria bacterium]|nr:T9SS type A sorting domain-containing protein [Candidatus Eisenbacteria bacterium]